MEILKNLLIKKIDNPDKTIFTQPVDFWIQNFMKPITIQTKISCGFSSHSIKANKSNFDIGIKILQICKDANVSPVNVNQAMWFFASRVVADAKRLETLVKNGNKVIFQKELDMIGEYLVI